VSIELINVRCGEKVYTPGEFDSAMRQFFTLLYQAHFARAIELMAEDALT
jgi:hypothetical protein